MAKKAAPQPQAKAKMPEFPLYLMKFGLQLEKMEFMPLQEAGVLYDSGWQQVEIGGLVLEADFSARSITDEEKRKISAIADAHSDSK